MTVLEVLYGLNADPFQRIIVRTKCNRYGFIPICGGFRDKVISCAGFRNVVGYDVIDNLLFLNVEFDIDDIV